MEMFIDRILEFQVRRIKVRIDEVKKPSGIITRRLIVDYPDAIAIVPFIPPNMVLLVKQFRYSINQEVYEFPAGKVDPDETLEDAVHRELMEETGYKAETIQKLYTYTPALGYSSEKLHIFFATDLTKTNYTIDIDEINNLEMFTLEEIWEGIHTGKFLDPKLVIGLSLSEKFGLLTKK